VQFSSTTPASTSRRQGAPVSELTSAWVAPDVPTIAEAALPDYESSQWFGVLTRAGTPHAIVERLNQQTNRILTLPDVRERLLALSYEIRGGTPEGFSKLLNLETEKWAKVIKTAGIKPQ
jgi:tripartite-type tricarboxylate transporter receptor subunit TctC